jgi:hypothetical protein
MPLGRYRITDPTIALFKKESPTLLVQFLRTLLLPSIVSLSTVTS